MATDAQILKETSETGVVIRDRTDRTPFRSLTNHKLFLHVSFRLMTRQGDEVDRQASAFETAQQPKLGNVRDSANESYLGKRKYVQCLRRPDTKSAEDKSLY